MIFINRPLFEIHSYKVKRECELFTIDGPFFEGPIINRDIKETPPFSIFAADTSNGEVPTQMRLHAFEDPRSDHNLCKVTAIPSEEAFKEHDGKHATFFVAIPIARTITKIEAKNCKILKSTLIRSRDKNFTWTDTPDTEDKNTVYNKVLLLIVVVEKGDHTSAVSITESSIGKQLATKITENPNGKSTVFERTVDVYLETRDEYFSQSGDDNLGTCVREGSHSTGVYPHIFKPVKKFTSNKELIKTAKNILANVKVKDLIVNTK